MSGDESGEPLSDLVFNRQSAIIRKLAEKGPGIFVGRCADYILGDYSNCINTFIYAYKDDRIRRIMKLYELNEKQAADKIKKWCHGYVNALIVMQACNILARIAAYFIGFEGKNLWFAMAVIGLGAIGKRVARRCGAGFGMKVLAHDPFWDEAYAKAHGITRAAPDEIFAECDVISLHLPLTPETENFIGAAELAKMKPDAILINTARGGLIDENALLDALEAGRLCGAGIDAFSSEPPKDPRWFTLDNVVLGSHCAASTAGASRNMGRMATANLIHDLGL